MFQNGTQPVLAPDVDLEVIGKSSQCDGYTGADLAALVHEAGLQALREVVSEPSTKPAAMVTTEHFNRAVLKIRPSTSDKVFTYLYLFRHNPNYVMFYRIRSITKI